MINSFPIITYYNIKISLISNHVSRHHGHIFRDNNVFVDEKISRHHGSDYNQENYTAKNNFCHNCICVCFSGDALSM